MQTPLTLLHIIQDVLDLLGVVVQAHDLPLGHAQLLALLGAVHVEAVHEDGESVVFFVEPGRKTSEQNTRQMEAITSHAGKQSRKN